MWNLTTDIKSIITKQYLNESLTISKVAFTNDDSGLTYEQENVIAAQKEGAKYKVNIPTNSGDAKTFSTVLLLYTTQDRGDIIAAHKRERFVFDNEPKIFEFMFVVDDEQKENFVLQQLEEFKTKSKEWLSFKSELDNNLPDLPASKYDKDNIDNADKIEFMEVVYKIFKQLPTLLNKMKEINNYCITNKIESKIESLKDNTKEQFIEIITNLEKAYVSGEKGYSIMADLAHETYSAISGSGSGFGYSEPTILRLPSEAFSGYPRVAESSDPELNALDIHFTLNRNTGFKPKTIEFYDAIDKINSLKSDYPENVNLSLYRNELDTLCTTNYEARISEDYRLQSEKSIRLYLEYRDQRLMSTLDRKLTVEYINKTYGRPFLFKDMNDINDRVIYFLPDVDTSGSEYSHNQWYKTIKLHTTLSDIVFNASEDVDINTAKGYYKFILSTDGDENYKEDDLANAVKAKHKALWKREISSILTTAEAKIDEVIEEIKGEIPGLFDNISSANYNSISYGNISSYELDRYVLRKVTKIIHKITGSSHDFEGTSTDETKFVLELIKHPVLWTLFYPASKLGMEQDDDWPSTYEALETKRQQLVDIMKNLVPQKSTPEAVWQKLFSASKPDVSSLPYLNSYEVFVATHQASTIRTTFGLRIEDPEGHYA